MIWLLTGCILRAPELMGVEVASAELDLHRSGRGSYILGGTRAEGWLHVTDVAGVTHSVPVRLGGPTIGAVWAFETSFEGPRWHTTTWVDTPQGLKGQHLIGFYSGESLSLAMMLGKRWRNLRNARGVVIHEEGPTMGFSLNAGADFVWLRPLPRPPLEGLQDVPEPEVPEDFLTEPSDTAPGP